MHGVCMHENQDDGDTLHLGKNMEKQFMGLRDIDEYLEYIMFMCIIYIYNSIYICIIINNNNDNYKFGWGGCGTPLHSINIYNINII